MLENFEALVVNTQIMAILHRTEEEFLNLFRCMLYILLSSFDTKVNMQMIVVLPLISPIHHEVSEEKGSLQGMLKYN